MEKTEYTGYIYKHLTEDRVPFYIGIGNQSEKNILKGKYPRAHSKWKRNHDWKRVFRKNPNYIIEIIIDQIPYNDALINEIKLIKFYGRKDKKEGTLVNWTDGGEGSLDPSIEIRNKISQAHLSKLLTDKEINKLFIFKEERNKSKNREKEIFNKDKKKHSKLSNEHIKEIKKLLNMGCIQSRIADKYNTSRTIILRIKNELSYKNIKFDNTIPVDDSGLYKKKRDKEYTFYDKTLEYIINNRNETIKKSSEKLNVDYNTFVNMRRKILRDAL
jgi:hypothetical protein